MAPWGFRDFYRRGSYCVLSFEAVSQLRKLGFKARRLEDGLPEWKAAGPVHRDHGFLNGACIWSRYGE